MVIIEEVVESTLETNIKVRKMKKSLVDTSQENTIKQKRKKKQKKKEILEVSGSSVPVASSIERNIKEKHAQNREQNVMQTSKERKTKKQFKRDSNVKTFQNERDKVQKKKSAATGAVKQLQNESSGNEMSDESEDKAEEDSGEVLDEAMLESSSKELSESFVNSGADEIGSGSEIEEDDCSSDEDDEELPIEKKAKKLQQKAATDKALADEELQLNIAATEKYDLPSIDDLENELKRAPKLQIIKQRISDVMQVLGDFKNRRDPLRSRGDYTTVLLKDLCTYYGYSEYLMSKFMDLFPLGSELLEFLEANDQVRPVTIRSNSLKTRRAELAKKLINRGMNVDPAAEWTKVGLIVYDSQVPIGATPEYLAGHYMLQGLSSLLPVMALAPQPNEIVLDMCAAPGGKSSYISALMKNTGVIYANDKNMVRCRAVIGNLHRMGVNNAVVSNLDGKEFAKIMPQGFDRVLLDAPCSGTGVVWKDESVKMSRTSQDVQRNHTLQRELILTALDAINANSSSGGYLVYSTCSVLVEENEAVVDYALRKRSCKLVPMGLNVGVEGFTKFREYRFPPSMNLSRRYYPHVHNIDGFFVAKLKKLSNDKRKGSETYEKTLAEGKNTGEENVTTKLANGGADKTPLFDSGKKRTKKMQKNNKKHKKRRLDVSDDNASSLNEVSEAQGNQKLFGENTGEQELANKKEKKRVALGTNKYGKSLLAKKSKKQKKQKKIQHTSLSNRSE